MLNTSFIERLNGTLPERLAALTRKCRHASSKLFAFHTGMYLIGCTYNFCWHHHELSKSIKKGGLGMLCTPAMASGLTDHQWSIFELLSYKVAPPALLIPKRRGLPVRQNSCSVALSPFEYGIGECLFQPETNPLDYALRQSRGPLATPNLHDSRSIFHTHARSFVLRGSQGHVQTNSASSGSAQDQHSHSANSSFPASARWRPSSSSAASISSRLATNFGSAIA
jgi:hypothetical protein